MNWTKYIRLLSAGTTTGSPSLWRHEKGNSRAQPRPCPRSLLRDNFQLQPSKLEVRQSTVAPPKLRRQKSELGAAEEPEVCGAEHQTEGSLAVGEARLGDSSLRVPELSTPWSSCAGCIRGRCYGVEMIPEVKPCWGMLEVWLRWHEESSLTPCKHLRKAAPLRGRTMPQSKSSSRPT